MNSGDQILQAGQNNWPSYGSNAGEKKNERMVMPVEEEESSIQDATEEQPDQKRLAEESYQSGQGDQRVQSVSVYETTTRKQDSTQAELEVNSTEGENTVQFFMETGNRTAADTSESQEEVNINIYRCLDSLDLPYGIK